MRSSHRSASPAPQQVGTYQVINEITSNHTTSQANQSSTNKPSTNESKHSIGETNRPIKNRKLGVTGSLSNPYLLPLSVLAPTSIPRPITSLKYTNQPIASMKQSNCSTDQIKPTSRLNIYANRNQSNQTNQPIESNVEITQQSKPNQPTNQIECWNRHTNQTKSTNRSNRMLALTVTPADPRLLPLSVFALSSAPRSSSETGSFSSMPPMYSCPCKRQATHATTIRLTGASSRVCWAFCVRYVGVSILFSAV